MKKLPLPSCSYMLGQRSEVTIAKLSLHFRLPRGCRLNPRTLHLSWRHCREGEWGEKGQIELEVIKSFPVRSDVSLRLHHCCSSSGCCGQMLLRTHKRDGWPLTGWGKTQVNFSGFLWRLGVLRRWWWRRREGFTRVEFTLWSPSGSRVHDPPPIPTSGSLCCL